MSAASPPGDQRQFHAATLGWLAGCEHKPRRGGGFHLRTGHPPCLRHPLQMAIPTRHTPHTRPQRDARHRVRTPGRPRGNRRSAVRHRDRTSRGQVGGACRTTPALGCRPPPRVGLSVTRRGDLPRKSGVETGVRQGVLVQATRRGGSDWTPTGKRCWFRSVLDAWASARNDCTRRRPMSRLDPNRCQPRTQVPTIICRYWNPKWLGGGWRIDRP